MKKASKAGRKSIITDEVLRKLEEAFEWGATDTEACKHAGIAPKTLYNYQRRKPGFVQRKELLKETPILNARKVVAKSISEKDDVKTAQWYLERKKKAEFSERMDVGTENGEPIVYIIKRGEE